MKEDVYSRLGNSTSDVGTSVARVQNISSSPQKNDAPSKRNLRIQRNIRHVLKFTAEENAFLKEGITKHGFGQWTAILGFPLSRREEQGTLQENG